MVSYSCQPLWAWDAVQNITNWRLASVYMMLYMKDDWCKVGGANLDKEACDPCLRCVGLCSNASKWTHQNIRPHPLWFPICWVFNIILRFGIIQQMFVWFKSYWNCISGKNGWNLYIKFMFNFNNNQVNKGQSAFYYSWVYKILIKNYKNRVVNSGSIL